MENSNLGLGENIVVIPSGCTTYSESAEKAFTLMAKKKTAFYRGGAVVEAHVTNQGCELAIITASGLRSKIEKIAKLWTWRAGPHVGDAPALKPGAKLSNDHATVFLASDERKILPAIEAIRNAPVISKGGGGVVISPRGYDATAKLLVAGGDLPDSVSKVDAVQIITGMFQDFHFATTADMSRAIAMLITPALTFGGILSCHIPMFVVEADDSQAGKGYMLELCQRVYREHAHFVAQKNGGVGGLDESLSQAMISGRAFIQIDNVRGKLNSQFAEAILTCPLGGTVSARVPHKGEIQVDPSRHIFQLTSNGFESTRDLANRSCIIRIKKRRGQAYRSFDGVDLITHVENNQARYLGAAFSIVAAWVEAKSPTTADMRGEGRFRKWSQTLDWIVQDIFQLPALMDGHEAAQERAGNPALTWLRQMALTIAGRCAMNEELPSVRMAEIAHEAGLSIPGISDDAILEQRYRKVGGIMNTIFKDTVEVLLDSFKITKIERSVSRDSGGDRMQKFYTFSVCPA